MEKISSILPKSPRVTSVDLTDAPPARPGAPALYGQKQGRNTIGDRVTLSKQAKELAAKDTMMAQNPKEASRAKMVEEINRNFFETRVKPVEKEIPQTEPVVEKVSDKFSEKSFDVPEFELPVVLDEPVQKVAPRSPEQQRLSLEA